MSTEAPVGWRSGQITDLVTEVAVRIDPRAAADPDTPYVGLEDIGQGTGTIVSVGRASDVTSQKSSFAAGDILFGKLRPNLRKVARPDFGGICSTDIVVFRAKSQVDPDFAFRVLSSGPVIEHAIAQSAGTKMPRAHARSVLDFGVTFPPPDEQRRIAEVLRSVDEAHRLNNQTLTQLRLLRARALRDMFTAKGGTEFEDTILGPLPRGWSAIPAEDICEAVIDCKNRTPPVTETGFAVVRTPNVRNGRFVRHDLVRTDPASFEVWTQRGRPRVGDVLITREAPIGEVCAVPADEPICLGQRMMLYRPAPSKLDSSFLLYALQSQPVQDHLRNLGGGSTVGHVRVGDIRTLPIPCPDKPTQIAIARVLAEIDIALDYATASCARTASLKVALQSDLISGRTRVPA
ncbi:restriction endonuclease subunit S [Bradyrhizobium sp. USDA 4452]